MGKFSLASQQLQRLENSFNESLGGISQTAGVRQQLQQPRVRPNQLVEVSHVGVLGKLRGQRVNELRDGARGLVVEAAEVVAHHLTGQDLHAVGHGRS